MTRTNDDPALPPPVVPTPEQPSNLLMLAVSWLGVGLPLAWGVAQTLKKALALFS